MTILEMLEQSALLTVLGMAIVFFFLWIMIICVNLTGKLVHKMGWDKDIPASETAPPKQHEGTVKPDLIAVLSAAVQEYRKTESTGAGKSQGV
ncbi:MAG: OadG family protein [Treponema sp.]|jgi:oxaloacetate decarboxylase gamma subunit|nr:OadG family protein [Treponema sp.]